MFWLKKAISYWLMPVPLCLALLCVGLLLAFSARRARLGRGVLAAALAMLALFANRSVSTALLSPLESQYPAIPEFAPGSPPPALSGCTVVAVLGSGNSDATGVPATSRLSKSGLSRVVEAVRLMSALPSAQLILSGPGVHGSPSHASVLARAAESLGADPARIILLETARDTEDEAQAVARLAGGRRVALVTSAWHMPRAAALFRRAGVNFVACPANFLAPEQTHVAAGLGRLGFDVESLSRSTFAVHEWVGLAWTRLRGAR